MTHMGFEHQCMDMEELTYSHCTSPDTFALHHFCILCHNLYKQTVAKCTCHAINYMIMMGYIIIK
jgi:hypothetical protein